MIVKITCRFCGKEGGSIDLPDEIWKGKNPTLEDLGIKDHRCGQHAALFGSLPEMEEYFNKEHGGTPEEFDQLLRESEWKANFFKSKVAAIVKARGK